MSSTPNELTAAEAARRIARGELTSEALVAACLERIAARERDVRAWAFLDADLALAQARRLDREAPRSPLHGVPFGIKDVIDTADMPTEYNSPIYRGHQPKWDAACVALLRRAGCVILGKTVTTEFANNHPSQTHNPRNLAHTPGGSSSGSAAAVADHMVPLALGTQTGGSTIRPAAYCGVVGYKPSFNSINRAGLKFVAESLDTIGMLARTAEDAALGLQVLSGRTAPDFSQPPALSPQVLPGRTSSDFAQPRGMPRIGVCRTPRWHDADAPTHAAIERVASQLANAGARVTDFELPAGTERLFDEHGKIMGYESARALAWEYLNHPDQISATLRPRLDEGWQLSRAAYDAARRLARDCRRKLADSMRDYDFLLTPSAPGEAPDNLGTTGSSVFNRVWTLFGVPCVTLPCGAGPRGLPLGVQLVGSFDGDVELLAWAHWCEQNIFSLAPLAGRGIGRGGRVLRKDFMVTIAGASPMKSSNGIGRALACALATLAAAAANAQNYPTKSVRLIVPYAPGGIVDYVGRLMGQRLSDAFGQNVVIDNRPGAGGIIGIETASKASADGYTLLVIDPAIVINPSLLARVPYDINKDLVPATILSSSPLVLAINAKVAANSVQELVALAKSQPGKLSFASAGIGTTPHMAGEMFKARIQQNITHVPYKGSGPAMTDLIAGQVQLTFSSITAALPFLKDGRLHGLATTGAKRAAALPNLPTVAESGFPGFEVDLWLAVFVPGATPKDVVVRINAELRKALQHPDIKNGFEKVGAEPAGNSLQEAAAFVKSEFRKWAEVIKTANIKAE